MTCRKCGKEMPAGAAVCPACGASVVPEVQPRPTVTVVPPYAQPPVQPAPPKPVPAPPPRKRRPTGARVWVVILSVLSALLELGIIFLWFWPTIRVTDDTSAASVTLLSMHSLCRDAAPYMSYIVPALCAVAALFTLAPLLRRYAEQRRRLWIPKLCTLLIAACYAVPYLVTRLAAAIASLTGGGRISHVNPFTAVCLALIILLWITSELTIRNMRLVLEHRAEDLRAQLLAYDIQPRF